MPLKIFISRLSTKKKTSKEKEKKNFHLRKNDKGERKKELSSLDHGEECTYQVVARLLIFSLNHLRGGADPKKKKGGGVTDPTK